MLHNNERGYTLVVALWALCLVLALLSALHIEVLTEAKISYNLARQCKLRYLAEAGLVFALTELGRDPGWRPVEYSHDLVPNEGFIINAEDEEQLLVTSWGRAGSFHYPLTAAVGFKLAEATFTMPLLARGPIFLNIQSAFYLEGLYSGSDVYIHLADGASIEYSKGLLAAGHLFYSGEGLPGSQVSSLDHSCIPKPPAVDWESLQKQAETEGSFLAGDWVDQPLLQPGPYYIKGDLVLADVPNAFSGPEIIVVEGDIWLAQTALGERPLVLVAAGDIKINNIDVCSQFAGLVYANGSVTMAGLCDIKGFIMAGASIDEIIITGMSSFVTDERIKDLLLKKGIFLPDVEVIWWQEGTG